MRPVRDEIDIFVVLRHRSLAPAPVYLDCTAGHLRPTRSLVSVRQVINEFTDGTVFKVAYMGAHLVEFFSLVATSP